MPHHMPLSCIVSEIFPLPYRTAVTSYVILYIAYRMLSRFWRCRSYKVKWNGLNLLKIIRNVAIWLIAYDFLLEFRALSLPCIVCLFSRYSERGVENHVFLPRVYITPLSSNPAEFRQYLWREKSTVYHQWCFAVAYNCKAHWSGGQADQWTRHIHAMHREAKKLL